MGWVCSISVSDPTLSALTAFLHLCQFLLFVEIRKGGEGFSQEKPKRDMFFWGAFAMWKPRHGPISQILWGSSIYLCCGSYTLPPRPWPRPFQEQPSAPVTVEKILYPIYINIIKVMDVRCLLLVRTTISYFFFPSLALLWILQQIHALSLFPSQLRPTYLTLSVALILKPAVCLICPSRAEGLRTRHW